MTLLTAQIVCGLLTWVALVTDGEDTVTPAAFARGLRSDYRKFGPWYMLAWLLLCLTFWWVVWLGWFAEWLDSRRG